MNVLPSFLSPKVEQKGDVKIITLVDGGECRDAENAIARQLEAHTNGLTKCHLLLDFTYVEWITSTELGTLIQLHKRLAAHGGRLTLFNLRDEIHEVFTVTRLDNLLTICRENGERPA